jgi:hypothetical protein
MFPARSSLVLLISPGHPPSLGRLILAFACLTSLVLPAAALDDKPNAAGQPAKAEDGAGQTKAAGAPSHTAEGEQQALGFARSQHPELLPLLERLRADNPNEYRKALTDLHRAEQKLHRMADQNPERYALSLALWNVQSRINLLAARMVREADGAHDENLKSLLAERRRLRIELLQFDRTRAAERVANLDVQLNQLQQDPDGDIEKELSKLKQTAAHQARTAKMIREKAKARLAPNPKQKPKVKDKPKDKSETGTKPDAVRDE